MPPLTARHLSALIAPMACALVAAAVEQQQAQHLLDARWPSSSHPAGLGWEAAHGHDYMAPPRRHQPQRCRPVCIMSSAPTPLPGGIMLQMNPAWDRP